MRPGEQLGVPEAVLCLTAEQGRRILADLPRDAAMRPALEAAVEVAVAEQRRINGRAGLN